MASDMDLYSAHKHQSIRYILRTSLVPEGTMMLRVVQSYSYIFIWIAHMPARVHQALWCIRMFFSRGKAHGFMVKVPLDAYAVLTSLSCSSTAPWTLGDGGNSCMTASPPTGFTGKHHPQTCSPAPWIKNSQTAQQCGQFLDPLLHLEAHVF